jgi:hypothetical protein
MSSLVVKRTSPSGDSKVEVDISELKLRLRSLECGCNLEIIMLAISSMLEEISDAVGEEYKE